MPRSRIIVDNRFRQLGDHVDNIVQHSLGQAAGVTIATARAVPSGYNIRDIQDQVAVGRPRRTAKGWELDIVWTDFRVWFFERGTYMKRGRLKRSRNTTGQPRGIKPVRFLRKGMKAGRLALIATLNRELT